MKRILLIIPIIALTSCSFSKQYTSNYKQPVVQTITGEKASEKDVVINMAVCNFDNYISEKQALKRFNEADNGYYINVIDYANLYDIDSKDTQNMGEAYTAADMQIVQDIINKNNINMTLDLLTGERIISLAQKGAFVDLNKFIENDTNFDCQILNKHILKLCELDDNLYYMPLGYGINTLYGYEKYVGKAENWNFSTMKSRWQMMPKNSLFCKQHYGGADTSIGIFFDICMNCVPSFIDYSTNKCNFESDGFIELLSFSNSFEKDSNVDKADIISGDWFVSNAKIEGFNKFKECLWDLESKEKLSFVGYPTIDSCNSYASVIGDVEICAKSSEDIQQGAWEFIKYLIDEKTQKEMYFHDNQQVNGLDDFETDLGFPINNNAFKDKANELISQKEKTLAMNGKEYNISNLSNEEVKILEDIINNTNNVEFVIGELNNIIYEEVAFMIDGEQTSLQTAKNIQNRVSILMNE